MPSLIAIQDTSPSITSAVKMKYFSLSFFLLLVCLNCICIWTEVSSSSSEEKETHLVMMDKSELMNIINCISSNVSHPENCLAFNKCEKMLPIDVRKPWMDCQKEYAPDQGSRKCTKKHPLFSDPSLPSQIFDCIVSKITIDKESDDDKTKIVYFEDCCRRLHIATCRNSMYC